MGQNLVIPLTSDISTFSKFFPPADSKWKVKVLVPQLCPNLCDPMDCSQPGSSVHGILQARILKWVAISSPGDLPDAGIEPGSPALQTFFIVWATREAQTQSTAIKNISVKTSKSRSKSQLLSFPYQLCTQKHHTLTCLETCANTGGVSWGWTSAASGPLLLL